jgi:hypothetical protein
VTAYQNEEVTSLKIKYNPFAKAFLDAKERPADSQAYPQCKYVKLLLSRLDKSYKSRKGLSLSPFPSAPNHRHYPLCNQITVAQIKFIASILSNETRANESTRELIRDCWMC